MSNIKDVLENLGLSRDRLKRIRDKINEPVKPTHESVGLSGHLRILGISKDREVWTLCDDKNIITNTGFTVLNALWGGPTSPNTYATMRPRNIGIGVGFEASPTATMTRLKMGGTPYTELPTYIAACDDPAVTEGSGSGSSVRLEMLVPNGTGGSPYNGATLQEAGLFSASFNGGDTGSGGMLAYKTYASILKSDQFSLLYQWRFLWSAV